MASHEAGFGEHFKVYSILYDVTPPWAGDITLLSSRSISMLNVRNRKWTGAREYY